jgi:cytochrome c biogenesis protein CcdA
VGTAEATSTSTREVPSEQEASGLLADALQIGQELRATLHDRFLLVSDEAQMAARGLAAMAAAAVAIGVLLAASWLGLLAAGVFALIGLGLSPVLAILIGTALDLVALLVLYELIRRKSRHLTFPATRRTLQPAAPHGSGSGADDRRAAA